MSKVSDPTRDFLEFAQGYDIDDVLQAAATLMAQAAMRRSGNLDEALAIFDLMAHGSRKAVVENWGTAR